MSSATPAAVLLDRDGTLVEDVPYNADPARVVPVPGAAAALAKLRAAGVPTALISNQSGVARGLMTLEQVEAVNHRLEELVGPLGPWLVCPHGPDDGCGCRKPAPGLVLAAAAALGVDPSECVVIGDIGSDIEAARSAGARGILVPTDVTRPEEVADAPEVAESLEAAVDLLVGEIGTVDLLVGEGGTVDLLVGEGGTVDLLVGEGGTVDLLVGEIGTVDLLVGRDGKDGTVDRLVGGR